MVLNGKVEHFDKMSKFTNEFYSLGDAKDAGNVFVDKDGHIHNAVNLNKVFTLSGAIFAHGSEVTLSMWIKGSHWGNPFMNMNL